MGAWILIVAFAATQPGPYGDRKSVQMSHHVAMQEFSDLQSCQHASIEAQKIAPGIRVVCVPKGVQK